MKRRVKIIVIAIGLALVGVLIFSTPSLNKIRSVLRVKSSGNSASPAIFPASLAAVGELSGGNGQNNSHSNCDKCMDDCMKAAGNDLSYVSDCAGTCGAECGQKQAGGNKNTKKYKYKLKPH